LRRPRRAADTNAKNSYLWIEDEEIESIEVESNHMIEIDSFVDPSKLREFADDVRDGKFVLPISRRLPLRDAGTAHDLMQKGGGGKIV
jgi:hypothetical protein